MAATYPVLGEQIRIGDIILQERPNYESRKLVTLAAAQGANSTPGGLIKGQILGVRGAINSTPTTFTGLLGDIQKSELVAIAATGASDVQTLTISGSAGTFYLKYKNTQSAVITVGSTTLAGLQAIIQAMHPDLAGATVTDSNSSASSTAIGTSYAVLVTTTAASILAAGAEVIDTFDIVGDSTWKVSSASVVAPITIVHTTIGWAAGAGACAILLQDAPYSASAQTVLCLVREAKVKPGYLLYGPSTSYDRSTEQFTAAQMAGVANALERRGMMIVATQPSSFTSAADVDLTESVKVPTQGIPGL